VIVGPLIWSLISYKEFIWNERRFNDSLQRVGTINTNFLEFRKDDGVNLVRDHGSLTAYETGITRLYGLVNVQDREFCL